MGYWVLAPLLASFGLVALCLVVAVLWGEQVMSDLQTLDGVFDGVQVRVVASFLIDLYVKEADRKVRMRLSNPEALVLANALINAVIYDDRKGP